MRVTGRTMRYWCYPLASGVNKLETLWAHMGTVTGKKSWEETVLAEIRLRRMHKVELDLIGTPELGDNGMIAQAVCPKVESCSE